MFNAALNRVLTQNQKQVRDTTRNEQPQILRLNLAEFRPNSLRLTGLDMSGISGTGHQWLEGVISVYFRA
jgi:hypothetical protein